MSSKINKITCNIIRQGNSAAITIPTAIMEQYGWKIGEQLKVPFYDFESLGIINAADETGKYNPKETFVGSIAKQRVRISKTEVIDFCDGIVNSGKEFRNVRKYYVAHKGTNIPPKVIITGVTKIGSDKFNAVQAKYILENLGFEVKEMY